MPETKDSRVRGTYLATSWSVCWTLSDCLEYFWIQREETKVMSLRLDLKEKDKCDVLYNGFKG